jgi:hypothetical protein
MSRNRRRWRMPSECAFRRHRALVEEVPTEKYGVPTWWFRCDECTSYTVSAGLLGLYAASWKHSATGGTLSRLAKRLTARGDRLELITETQLKQALAEQGAFEQEHPAGGPETEEVRS